MDREMLVRPLQGSSGPCGEDMMFSPEFDAIQAARCFDDPSLAQGDWVIDVKEADWPQVIRVCEALLGQRTKDLRVAVWLTEALTKTRGLAGLAEGYALLTQLCENLWAGLYPLPDDGDMEARIGNLDWLVAQSIRLIQEIPLTRSAKGNFSSSDLESARAATLHIERNPGQAEELTRNARVTLALFEAARKETAGAYFVTAMEDAERALAAVEAFKSVVDGLLGHDAPALGGVFEALEAVRAAFHRYAVEAGALVRPADPTAVEATAQAPGGAAKVEALHSSGPVQSREQAVRQLNEIAAFFKRTEPHSPVAYLVEKAAKWSAMPLHEWLRSVVKDDSTLSRVEELLGVEPDRSER